MAPVPPPDLDAYFARIGYTGPREATPAVLTELVRRHVYTIPFENLDVLLGRPVRLDPAAIEQKLVRDRRGGYCFEHNAYFARVLRALGCSVAPLAARVRWQVPEDMATGLTHMTLLVQIHGRRFVADVGFGSLSLTAPLELDHDGEQPTPHEPRRIVPRDGLFIHQARIGSLWSDVYRFTLEEQTSADYEVSNWLTSTHPQSRFTQNLVAARAADGRRFTLFNAEFTIRELDGHAEKRTLRTPDELLAVLAETFGLHFPADTRFGPPGAPWPR